MDENPEVILKKICCTCLTKERKLFQLCRLTDGVNNLYLLLSYDSEAYREGFYKDTASLFICWECRAIMSRISKFREQACTAQKRLASIADGRTTMATQSSLSHLSTYRTESYITFISESNTLSDNFIDCGLDPEIKSEAEEDIPLSELHSNWLSDTSTEYKVKNKTRKRLTKRRKYFTSTVMADSELKEVILKKKMAQEFIDAEFKCDSCVESFESNVELAEHNKCFHEERPNHIQCDICLMYIKESVYQDHRENHFHRFCCLCCEYVTYADTDMLTHLREEHEINLDTPEKKKKGRRKLEMPRSRTKSLMDKKTPYGYMCKECNKYFDNKNQRWKHIQRHHKEGYNCSTCGKRFAFKNNLARHELLHQGPPPRTECVVCHKMVRVDLLKVHSRIHSAREQYSCMECSKSFVSRASYEHHLKYTQAHAATDILKYKCTICDKGYRSRGELRDHVNYQHMGKTQHKCPICDKALATRRCITRHVRRAHDGVKESARDKICQQCGKAFRDKKGLREHELIHTGERPLSCEICGCTFRQSASLYTHRKRVHKIYPPTKRVQLLT